jgi:hypothetical protein
MPAILQSTAESEKGETKTIREYRENQGTEFYGPFFGVKVKITDALLVIFTAILAIFTGCLYFSTRKLWKAGEEQMRITRDSLHLAKEEFIATHRPRLIVRSVTLLPPRHPSLPIEPGEPIQIEWAVVNVGNTPAKIIEGNATHLVGGQSFNARTPYSSERNNMTGIALIPGGAYTFVLQADGVDVQNPAQLDIISRGGMVIYFFGFIMYQDDIGNVRRTAFCRRYDPIVGRFRLVDDPDYEYTD